MVLVASSFAFAAHLDNDVKGAMNGQELVPVIVQMAPGHNNVNADDVWNSTGAYNGAGVTIVIIDTGIAPHQDFGNRIVGWLDIVKGKTAPYDDHGHGTHCAGIKFAVNFGVDVITMSLGGPIAESFTTDPSCIAVKNAWNAGVVVVVAAGNSGPSSYTIGSPGNEPTIITVGAANDMGTTSISDDTMAYFSSVGPTSIDNWVKPDVCAPGYNITACDNATSGYVTMSGTSMATPCVAGIIGQILQAHPTWSPDTVKSTLMNTARDLGYTVYHQGAGLVDVYDAIY
ncbi:MAG: S8 family serine peptidase [Halanaerobiales bacterium]|nr:S8 family serine peptidase [Halanaerobiales bacterium]